MGRLGGSQLGVILTILQVIKIRIFSEHTAETDIWPGQHQCSVHRVISPWSGARSSGQGNIDTSAEERVGVRSGTPDTSDKNILTLETLYTKSK